MSEVYFKSKFLYKKKPRRNFRPLVFGLILLVVSFSAISFGIIYTFRLPFWQIKNITISGLETIENDEVFAAVQSALEGYTAYFFPNSQFFLADGFEISRVIKEKFPRLRLAQVKKTYPDSLDIYLEEREAYVIYCRISGDKSLKEGGFASVIQAMRKGGEAEGCFYADRNGAVFENLAGFTGSAFPVIRDDKGDVSGDRLKKLIDYFDESGLVLGRKIGIALTSLLVSSEIPKDYLLGTDAGWFIAVSRDDFAGNWASLLKTIIDEKIKDRLGDLDYVDLRFGSKVFYKFR